MPVADLLWWWWADRWLRPLRRAKLWRGLLAALVALLLVGFATVIGGRFIGMHSPLPAGPLAVAYVWHIVVLPAIALAMLLAGLVHVAFRAVRRRQSLQTDVAPEPQPQTGPSRREVIAAAAVAVVPPLFAGGMVTKALSQLDDFRINRMTIPLRDLPADLDGLTIAHVSDVHLGRFTRAKSLAQIADATNALRADLVMLTGDLLDFSISDLGAGIDFVRSLDPRSGLFMIEGNHDLFEDRDAFEQRVQAAGIPLLLNDAKTARVHGIDVQVLGIKWGGPRRAGADGAARLRGGMWELHTADTLSQLRTDPGAFPILLAHHPHAFDLAAEKYVPLTLAGHTHGGQLMLTRTVGAGSLMFKYWSGLYRKQDATRDSALVVSNGVGNWFPLRINAPAEIVHITLRRA